MKHWLKTLRSTAVALLALTSGWAGFAAAQDEKVTYDDQIKPLLQRRCAVCHSPDKKSADLDVTNYTHLMQGGASGTVIEPGDPSSSYLYLLITHQETPNMPPDGASKLPDDALALVERWISQGALENSGSAPREAKPQFALAPPGSALTRPEDVALPPRLVLEPAIQTARPASVLAVAVHPWAPLAVLSSHRQLLLYDLNLLELRGILPFPQGQATVVRFSRDGGLLWAAGGQHGAGAKVYGWDVRTGEPILEMGDEVDAILAADVSADLSRIALGGPQKTVRVYATADGALLYEIKKHTEWITALEFSPDGVLLATGDRNGGLYIWETETGNEYLALAGHAEMVSAVSWRHDSNLLASASDDDTIRLWEVENGRQVKSWPAHGGGVTDVRFSRDGQMASVGRDHAAKLWNQDGGAIRQFDGLQDQALSVAVCLESNSVIATDWSGLNRVWTLADGTPRGDLTSNPPPLAQRLAAARQELVTVAAELEPLAAAVAATTQQIAHIDEQLRQVQDAAAAARSRMTEAAGQLTMLQQRFEAACAAQDAMQGEFNSKKAAHPILSAARAKAGEALAALPGDADLEAAVATLTGKLHALERRLEELTPGVAQAERDQSALRQQMDEWHANVHAVQAEVDARILEAGKLEAQKQTLGETLREQQQSAQATSERVQAAEQAVVRWQGEIDFKNSLDQLKAEWVTTHTAMQERLLGLEQAERELEAVRQRVEDERAQAQSLGTRAAEVRERIKALREGR